MQRSVPAVTLLLVFGSIAVSPVRSAGVTNADLERKFAQTVRPFVNRYCIGCHGGATPAAQFDLRSYSTVAAVIKDYPHWNLLMERLVAKEMPPKVAPQPPDEARQAVIDWVAAVRANEARKYDGDPGPVLVRRLSNAEYNNSIRDLTGVDMRPTREFPVDPANTAGFDNSGESLSMSPALLNKYLQAAREVADHMVLNPDGFDFATHPMLVETDRDRYSIKRILDFYASQPTDYADYFEAAWRFKHRAALGKPSATLAGVAAEMKLSPKYLAMIWPLLEETPEAAKKEVGPIAKLQAMWRALPGPAENAPIVLHAKCTRMREFVIKIRKHTAMQFYSPIVRGLPAGSQPLLNWKLRNYNLHRRDSDPQALRNDTDPPLAPVEVPRYPGLHQEGGFRWAALSTNARVGDLDLVVPAAERSRYEASFQRLASVFPDGFYVTERGRYFPDDSQDRGRFLSAGYHNVMGYYRDDNALMELILDEKGQKQLNRLWDEFDFIADHTNRTWDQFFFNQAGAVDGKGAESGRPRPLDKKVNDPAVIFGLRDDFMKKALADPKNDPAAAQAIEYHFKWENDTLRRIEKMRLDAEPYHLDALVKFAGRAFRRPLTQAERADTLAYYQELRSKGGLSHEDAMRDSIVSILMSPKFSYRVDLVGGSPLTEPRPSGSGNATRISAKAPATPSGLGPVVPLSPYALASRLSYFLWSSIPDDQLLARAASGDLQKPEVLLAQARRMLKDERARGLAIDFAGNWLDYRRFEDLNTVDRERFPAFNNDLREAMFQEPVRFIEDVIRNDRSVLDMLYANYTFVNPVLAKHYEMPEVEGGLDHWVRVDNAREYGRGGILPMAAFLTQNSPGLRTSPVKRGYWVVRRVLGEVIPPPPPNVPELPQDEAKMDLPLREMLAKHRSNPACASCHSHFDSFGLVFEGYGPVGERRAKDLASHTVDSRATFPGGGEGSGLEGVQTYIRAHRQNDFINNLSRKLLAYALGRSLQLSDEPAIDRMQTKLTANGYRFNLLVETIVTSPQFLNKRGPEILTKTNVARKGE